MRHDFGLSFAATLAILLKGLTKSHSARDGMSLGTPISPLGLDEWQEAIP